MSKAPISRIEAGILLGSGSGPGRIVTDSSASEFLVEEEDRVDGRGPADPKTGDRKPGP